MSQPDKARSAAHQSEQAADAFGKGGPYHGFHFRGAANLRPGLYYRRIKLVPVSMWFLRPRYSWNVRGYGRRWT